MPPNLPGTEPRPQKCLLDRLVKVWQGLSRIGNYLANNTEFINLQYKNYRHPLGQGTFTRPLHCNFLKWHRWDRELRAWKVFFRHRTLSTSSKVRLLPRPSQAHKRLTLWFSLGMLCRV